MVGYARHNFGMCGLNEEGPDPADERRGVAEYRPGDRLRSEQSGVATMVEGVGQRVGSMSK
jgi:hypothetical protein